MSARRHPTKVRETAVRRVLAGDRLSVVSESVGVPKPTISRWAKEAGVPLKQGRPSDITDAGLEYVRTLVVELGLSDGIVAMVFCVAESTVQGWRRRLGLRRHKSKTRLANNHNDDHSDDSRTRALKAKVAEFAELGLSDGLASWILAVPPWLVTVYRRRLGLSRRKWPTKTRFSGGTRRS